MSNNVWKDRAVTTEAEVAQIIENLRQTVKASEAKDKHIKQLEMQADRMRADLAKALFSSRASAAFLKADTAELAKARKALEKIAYTSLMTGAQAHDIAIEVLEGQVAVQA